MNRRNTIGLAAVLGIGAATAVAATIHVPGDYPTIQAAINAAAAGDEVVVAPGTYHENINFLGKAITVRSSGGAEVTTIDGQDIDRTMKFITNEPRTSMIDGFTVTGGGAMAQNASPTIRAGAFHANSPEDRASILAYYGSPLVEDCTFPENVGLDWGGGNAGGAMHIGPEPYVTHNDVHTGRAIFIRDRTYAGGYAAGSALPHDACRSAVPPDQARLSADAFVAQYGAAFGPSQPTEALDAYYIVADSLGMTHVRYRQRHHGVVVYGADLFVHLDASGRVVVANGYLAPDIEVFVTPSITDDLAVVAAIEAWSRQFPPELVPEVRSTKLYILVPDLVERNGSSDAYLVWEIALVHNCQGIPFEYYYIDAETGMLRWQQAGARSINRSIFDCSPNPSTGLCYSRYTTPYYPNYIFGRKEGDPPRPIHPIYHNFNTNELYDRLGYAHGYCWETFGRNGINAQGGLGYGTAAPTWGQTWGLIYLDSLPGMEVNCPNAWFAYDRVQFCNDMVAEDVVGHEYFHGLSWFSHFDDQGTPIGTVYFGESGALDESISDIYGELVQLYITQDTDWIAAAASSLGPVRNLADPAVLISPTTGLPYPARHRDPHYYCGQQDHAGVHVNSTVPSHAAYLVSEGGSFNGCEIEGIGTDKLAQIWYRATAEYFTRTETFNGAYSALIQACYDLYGEGCDECWQLTKALRAVEMDQPGYCTGLPGWFPLCRFMAADIDQDGDVDLDDFEVFAACMSGPTVPHIAGCELSDADGDGDVDLADFAILSRQYGESDCNRNAVPDGEDIALGTSPDCNANGVPDECDVATGTSLDCNANGVPDECDVATGTSLDCNANGVPDECDAAAGTSLDCNANGVPDECDIASGFSADCQPDGIPDECQLTLAQLVDEGFVDITVLPGWYTQNNSNPLGITNWFQGDIGVFAAHGGPPSSYIAGDYNHTSGTGTISNWLLTPELTLEDGLVVEFYTRCRGRQYPDRMQVRMSLAGSSTNVGTTATSVGDFTTLLLDINPNLEVGGYPTTWDDGHYMITLSGIGGPTQGRIAFRYFVTGGGPSGTNSDYIGIDTVTVRTAISGDCNANGVPDFCDIVAGTSLDLNQNGIPDECE